MIIVSIHMEILSVVAVAITMASQSDQKRPDR